MAEEIKPDAKPKPKPKPTPKPTPKPKPTHWIPTTKGPTGQTTSHPTQMETTLGHSPLLVQVETSSATCPAI